MDNKLFDLLAPPENHIFPISHGVWRTTYRNAGKARLSAELVGHYIKGTGDLPDIRLLNGLTLSPAEFDAYRRVTWPAPHEKDRNPQNTTLGVKSTSAAAKSNF